MTKFTLRPLPYQLDALEPVMSARTVQTHHDKDQGGFAVLGGVVVLTFYRTVVRDRIRTDSKR